MKTEGKSSKVAVQKLKEEQASPRLIKQDVEEKVMWVKVKEEKELRLAVKPFPRRGPTNPRRKNQLPNLFCKKCPDTPSFPSFSSPSNTHMPITSICHPQHFSKFAPPYTTPFFIPPPCPQWVLCGGCH